MATYRFGPYTVEASNEDKLLFPDDGLTKGDLIAYYDRIAPMMLPHLRERPLALHRYPDGIHRAGFVQQACPDYFPAWIARATVDKEGGTITHAVCNHRAALVYLANQGVVTPHVWLSRTDRPRHPDRLVFDLDPPDDDTGLVRDAARAVRALLDDLGLPAYVMTTGSRGLHVVTPLDRSADYDTVRAFARDAADLLTHRHPDLLTTEPRRADRRGRLYLDTLRNAYGQTTVPPYAVRPRPGAPVATPLHWAEVDDPTLASDRYTIRNLFRRLAQVDDPWAGLARHAHALRAPRERLDALRATD